MADFRVKVRAVDVPWDTLPTAALRGAVGAGVIAQGDGLYSVIYTATIAGSAWWQLPEVLKEGRVRDIWIESYARTRLRADW